MKVKSRNMSNKDWGKHFGTRTGGRFISRIIYYENKDIIRAESEYNLLGKLHIIITLLMVLPLYLVARGEFKGIVDDGILYLKGERFGFDEVNRGDSSWELLSNFIDNKYLPNSKD